MSGPALQRCLAGGAAGGGRLGEQAGRGDRLAASRTLAVGAGREAGAGMLDLRNSARWRSTLPVDLGLRFRRPRPSDR
jgi:hypothetical protein